VIMSRGSRASGLRKPSTGTPWTTLSDGEKALIEAALTETHCRVPAARRVRRSSACAARRRVEDRALQIDKLAFENTDRARRLANPTGCTLRRTNSRCRKRLVVARRLRSPAAMTLKQPGWLSIRSARRIPSRRPLYGASVAR